MYLFLQSKHKKKTPRQKKKSTEKKKTCNNWVFRIHKKLKLKMKNENPPSLLSPGSPTNQKNSRWPKKGKSQKQRAQNPSLIACHVAEQPSAITIMTQNLPSTSFLHCPIYTALPHPHTLAHQQGHSP